MILTGDSEGISKKSAEDTKCDIADQKTKETKLLFVFTNMSRPSFMVKSSISSKTLQTKPTSEKQRKKVCSNTIFLSISFLNIVVKRNRTSRQVNCAI